MSVFETRFSIESGAQDCFGVCKASAVLGFLTDAAGRHVTECGYNRAKILKERGVVWVLSRTRFFLTRPLHAEESLTVRTWLRGTEGTAAFYRDYDFYLKKEKIGYAVSRWTWLDLETGTLLRPELPAGLTGGEVRKERLTRLSLPAMEPARTRLLYYSDGDINRHVHNTRYADFACDALNLEEKKSFVSSMQVNFLTQTKVGETLYLTCGAKNGVSYVSGSDVNGKQHFEASVGLKNL
ncbi:MAG TPA: thioesterase [Oscillospiraceae bacterium]|nr:thioesterase [Oscillospiraceae bacterium]